MSYGYDAVGNRTSLVYPDSAQATYTYDAADRLVSVAGWDGASVVYSYDAAGRPIQVTMLNTLTDTGTITGTYTYDDAGQLTLLSYENVTETLTSYAYSYDAVGNRVLAVEMAAAPLPGDAFWESDGQVVINAEHFAANIPAADEAWITSTALSGYTGTHYLGATPDRGTLHPTEAITGSPELQYLIYFTTPLTGSGPAPLTYTVWLRGYAIDAAGDSVHVGLDGQIVGVTGFAPGEWTWANLQIDESASPPDPPTATLVVDGPGLYTLSVWVREDGVRLDRILLTTDTTYIPSASGPPESPRVGESGQQAWAVGGPEDWRVGSSEEALAARIRPPGMPVDQALPIQRDPLALFVAPLALLAPFGRRRKGRRGATLAVALLLALALFLTGSAFATGATVSTAVPVQPRTAYSVLRKDDGLTDYAMLPGLPVGRSTQYALRTTQFPTCKSPAPSPRPRASAIPMTHSTA